MIIIIIFNSYSSNKVDGHRMRYFVFIDQDSNIKSVFIPRKNEQTTTQIYLQSLSHLLLE